MCSGTGGFIWGDGEPLRDRRYTRPHAAWQPVRAIVYLDCIDSRGVVNWHCAAVDNKSVIY
jgi:hypothetical protein